jgi:membrane associated rhomboid family serine protease
MERSPINGGGTSTTTLGFRLLIGYRFITPIFLHAGFVHIILNMLAQLTAGAEVSNVAQIICIIDCPYISD